MFASPPWGGPGYTTEDVFDLTTMAPYSAQFIHQRCKLMDTALFVPRTSDVRQIARLCPEGAKIEVSLSLLLGMPLISRYRWFSTVLQVQVKRYVHIFQRYLSHDSTVIPDAF